MSCSYIILSTQHKLIQLYKQTKNNPLINSSIECHNFYVPIPLHGQSFQNVVILHFKNSRDSRTYAASNITTLYMSCIRLRPLKLRDMCSCAWQVPALNKHLAHLYIPQISTASCSLMPSFSYSARQGWFLIPLSVTFLSVHQIWRNSLKPGYSQLCYHPSSSP